MKEKELSHELSFPVYLYDSKNDELFFYLSRIIKTELSFYLFQGQFT